VRRTAEETGKVFKCRSILTQFSLCITALLVLLIISASIGVVGLNKLFTTANHAMGQDVRLAQRAANIDILVLNERRYEKDAFINLADAAKFSSYRQKWDTARTALLEETTAAGRLDLDDTDQRSLRQIQSSYHEYAGGFNHTIEMIRSGQIKNTQEANAEFTRYKDAVHETEDATEQLNRRAVRRVDAVGASLAATRTRSAALQIGLAMLCVILGIPLCVATARSITRPLIRAREVAEAVATGKLDNQIDTTGADETAKVLSALKVMQEALLENALNAKGQLAAIGKSLSVVELNLDGTIRTANANFLQLFGYEPGEIFGQHRRMFLEAAERAQATENTLWEQLGRGEFATGQYKWLAKDGREVFLEGSYNPILNLRGVPYKVVMYATDVTQQVLASQQMQQAVAQTQQAIKSAGDGDLQARVATHDKTGELRQMAESINSLLASMAAIVSKVKSAANEVYRGAEEISQGSTNLSRRTEQQAASLEETASSMEEMTATVRQNADNAAQANQLAAAARDQAERGRTVTGRAVHAMSQINVASRKIADIIGVIDEIAFQTNLLALNAAVEAARAGEQGRGFAVVATEVRNLAGRSATAAKQIKDLIQDSVKKVEDGSVLVTQSGETLQTIVTSVKKVSDIVAEIAAASRDQSSEIEEVSKAVMQMDEMTQQNAALVEQATAASQSMAGQARNLNAIMAGYRVDDSTVAEELRDTPTKRPAASQPAGRRSADRTWSERL
jgi:methyl-accepting chemotaxis protein